MTNTIISAVLTAATLASANVLRRDLVVQTSGSWTSLGCYSDTQSSRTLNVTGMLGDNVSDLSCQATCQKLDYVYAGTEYAGQCFCGNTINPIAVQKPSSDCNMACTGDSTQPCGGPDRINLFSNGTTVDASASATPASASASASASSKALPTGWKALGCLTDAVGARALSNYIVGPSTGMTVEYCTQGCAAAGYAYGGVEYGDECYCGNTIQNGHSLASAGCNMVCSGDSTEICGGPNRLSLYGTSMPDTAVSSSAAASSSTVASSSAPAVTSSAPASSSTVGSSSGLIVVSPASVSSSKIVSSSAPVAISSEAAGNSSSAQATASSEPAGISSSAQATVLSSSAPALVPSVSAAVSSASADISSSTPFIVSSSASAAISSSIPAAVSSSVPATISTAPASSSAPPSSSTVPAALSSAAPLKWIPQTIGLPQSWSYDSCRTWIKMSTSTFFGTKNTPAFCINDCENRGFKVATLVSGTYCGCGSLAQLAPQPVIDAAKCDAACYGDTRFACGGYNNIAAQRGMSVYIKS